jgi:crotonobetainyl-CoA:carnitine CoA-transferase CaiB-like acyl-CoA transferase
VADSAAGLYGALGAFVAITERETSGKGQWVQTSLLEAQIAMMDFQAARFLVEGTVPPQAGNDHPYSTPMGVVRTSDGYINIGVGGQGQWKSFCVAIGHPDLADHPDYKTGELRFRNRPRLNAQIAAIFAGKTSTAWLDLLESAGVPAGPIYKMDAVFEDPQVQHLEMAVPMHHPARGDIRVVGQPIDMSRTPATVRHPLPEPGANTEEILAEIGITGQEIAALRQDKAI